MNSWLFDYEPWLFQRKIIVTGYIINDSATVQIKELDTFSLNYLRFKLNERLTRLLDNRAVSSLIIVVIAV